MKFTQSRVARVAALSLIILGTMAKPAFATEPTHGVSDAYDAYSTLVNELTQGQIETPVTAAVQVMVAEGIQALREAGYGPLADRYEAEWHDRYNRLLTAADFVPGLMPAGKDDLGDHAPASQWLADFYDKLVTLTHGVIRQVRLIEDINTMNYALPVVFAPKGTWRTGVVGDDKIEYRKHFIPFTNIITYWVTREVCEWACKRYVPEVPQLSQLCEPAASRLEHYMGRYVAWQISDFIYAKANGLSKEAEQLRIDLSYFTEHQLEQEVLEMVDGGLK